MIYQKTCATPNFASSLRTVVTLFCAAIFATAICAQGQTFSVLHSLTGGADGGQPVAGVTLDTAGNLYGTTVWELTP